jgi:DNA-binding MarR family transcriptional regulator
MARTPPASREATLKATVEATLEDRLADECHSLPLRMIHRAVMGIYDAALRPFDLRVAQMNLLVVIAKMGVHATPARLSSYLIIEKSTLSRDLERLEQRRLIKVVDEGRTRRLSLTAEARRLLERVLPVWEEAQAQVDALLGAGAVEALRKAAPRIRARLQADE